MVVHGRRHSLRRRGQGFWDDSTKHLVQNSVIMGEGVKNYPDLCEVIFGRPLSRLLARGSEEWVLKVTFISSSCLSLKRFQNVMWSISPTFLAQKLSSFCQSTSTGAMAPNLQPKLCTYIILEWNDTENILCKLIGEMFETGPLVYSNNTDQY